MDRLLSGERDSVGGDVQDLFSVEGLYDYADRYVPFIISSAESANAARMCAEYRIREIITRKGLGRDLLPVDHGIQIDFDPFVAVIDDSDITVSVVVRLGKQRDPYAVFIIDHVLPFRELDLAASLRVELDRA